MRLGHAGIVDPFISFIDTLKKRKRKGNGHMNAKWQISVPYGSMRHITPTNYHLLGAKHLPYQKPFSLRKMLKNVLEKESQENGPVGRKEKEK